MNNIDALDILAQVEKLDHLDYGHVYIEYGGSKDYRVVSYCKEGFWYYTDGDHTDRKFRCSSLLEALKHLAKPPLPMMWTENLDEQRAEGIII